jgi:hypothetical protein
VTIESAPRGSPICQACVTVERRTDATRREGHQPPVIAQASAASEALVFRELFPIASDDNAIARGLIAWQAAGVRAAPAEGRGQQGVR